MFSGTIVGSAIMNATIGEINELTVLGRVINPASAFLSRDGAESILTLKLSEADRQRMHELAALAREGVLTDALLREVEVYSRISSLLTMLHSKARITLRNAAATAVGATARA
jgi:hypothetical protein